MANFHASFSTDSRSSGKSSVRSSCYINATKMKDKRLGQTFDYTRKKDVTFSAIMAPDYAPMALRNRETLWNTVEFTEKRKDAQLARKMECSLPIELNHEEQVKLITEFVQKNFVEKGMIADVAIHSAKGNPHAHIMLTMRHLTKEGFGNKNRSWNRKENVLEWRKNWAEIQNEYLARIGKDIRLDHRSYADQGIDITPQVHLGAAHAIQKKDPEAAKTLEKVQEAKRIARENGEKIIRDPLIALEHLSYQQAVFTQKDIYKYAHRYSADADQYHAVVQAVETSPELVSLGEGEEKEPYFTTRSMLRAERKMFENVRALNLSSTHAVSDSFKKQAKSGRTLTSDQERAFNHILDGNDIVAVVGYAGTGKSYTLGAVREAYEAQGYTVQGMALSGIAAQGLENGSGITSQTIHRKLWEWEKGMDALSNQDVLIIDEAGMVGTRLMHQVVGYAKAAGAKVIMVGDENQLQPIEAGGPFRGIVERIGFEEIAEIKRQEVPWQKEATRLFAGNGRGIGKAIDLYADHGRIHDHETLDEAKASLIDAWEQSEGENLILAFRNKDVEELNKAARQIMKKRGVIDQGALFDTEKGVREFAEKDRVMFLKNDRTLGVKNGTLGTVESIGDHVLAVRVEDRVITVDTHHYAHIDHGYAATVHKSQGATVDRTFVLGSSHFNKHLAYVAMSRHRKDAQLFVSRDKEGFRNIYHMKRQMSRKEPKRLVSDFSRTRGIEPLPKVEKPLDLPSVQSVLYKYSSLAMDNDLLAGIGKEKNEFILRVEDYRQGISHEDRVKETDQFKKAINLSGFALAYGYDLDFSKSYPNVCVMNGSQDRIHITRDEKGEYGYFSPVTQKSGNIMDFLQDKKPEFTPGEIRKALRPFLSQTGESLFHRPYQKEINPVEERHKENVKDYQLLKAVDDHPYLSEHHIPPHVSEGDRFKGKIFQGGEYLIFPHRNDQGLCGYEIWSEKGKYFSSAGEKGVWCSNVFKGDTRLVITQSPMDALSFERLYGREQPTRYFSSMGEPDQKQLHIFERAINKLSRGSEIVLAMERSPKGVKSLERIIDHLDRKKIREKEHKVKRYEPKHGKNITETLAHEREAVRQMEHIQQIERNKGFGMSM